MDPSIRAVLFDMDDVLCDYDFARRMSHMARATGLSAESIQEKIWDSGFDQEADEGRHTADEYLKGFQVRLGVPLSRADWVAARAASMTPNQRVLSMARTIAKRLPIALLTNNGFLLKETLPNIFPEVIEIFGERAFVSAQFGFAKPDVAVFHAVAERLGLEPDTLLFIDDQADYVAGARQAGLQVHKFDSAEGLERALVTLRLL